jgi:hypothetical protein
MNYLPEKRQINKYSTFKSIIKKLPIIGSLIKLYRLLNLVADFRNDCNIKETERLAREQALNDMVISLSEIVTNLSQNVNILLEKTDNLQHQIDIFEIAERINRRIQRDNELNIIPIMIDCEYPIFNHFLEPVIQELFQIKEYKFDFFFGELNRGDGSSYFCYNNENSFPVSIYNKIIENVIFLSPVTLVKGPVYALKIIIDHGICSSKTEFLPKELYENFNIYCVTGKLFETKIKKILIKYELQNKVEVINGGYPKSDKLFQENHPSKKDIFKKLNMDPEKKTLLYAPSWDKGLSLREFGVPLIDIILKNDDYNLIVKLHPNSFRSKNDNYYIHYTGGIDWKQQFMPYSHKQNFSFILDFNIIESLIISDIMITDLSSVALEFLAFEKPVIYLDCPNFEETYKELYSSYNYFSYKELLEDPYSNAGRHVGLINYDYKTILDDISFLIKNPDYKINERKEYSKKILSNKGHASEFYANMIISKFFEYKK